jgi:hypothetical protein
MYPTRLMLAIMVFVIQVAYGLRHRRGAIKQL